MPSDTQIVCSDFDLALTLKSGQVFRWKEESPSVFSGRIGGSPVRVTQRGGRLRVDGVPHQQARHFFALDVDLPGMTRRFDVDPVIHSALRQYPGLRVIRQDPWECTASFLLSAFNNIVRLTGMLNQLSQCFGRLPGRRDRKGARNPTEVPRSTSASLVPRYRAGHHGRSASDALLALPARGGLACEPFPRPEAIAQASEKALRACGLGYRAPYLKAVAQKVASGAADLEKWQGLEDDALREKLLALPGIGEKVAECILLFGYGRGSAFPVDVWIGRVMRNWYFKRRRKVSDRKIREFALKHFGPDCGWAQQYLFCLARWKPELRAPSETSRGRAGA